MFKDESNKNNRIFLMALAEPEADDKIITMNNIKLAIASIMNPNTQNLILETSNHFGLFFLFPPDVISSFDIHRIH